MKSLNHPGALQSWIPAMFELKLCSVPDNKSQPSVRLRTSHPATRLDSTCLQDICHRFIAEHSRRL